MKRLIGIGTEFIVEHAYSLLSLSQWVYEEECEKWDNSTVELGPSE